MIFFFLQNMHRFCADLLKHTINFTQGDVCLLFFLWRIHTNTMYFILTLNQRNGSIALIYSCNKKEHLLEIYFWIFFLSNCFRRFSIIFNIFFKHIRQSSMFLKKGVRANDLYLKKSEGNRTFFSRTLRSSWAQKTCTHFRVVSKNLYLFYLMLILFSSCKHYIKI